jgi:plastocyanin
MSYRLFALAALVSAFTINAAFGTSLQGTVQLRSDGKALRPAAAQEVVVYFRPATAVKIVPAAKPYEMKMYRKQFVPNALPITVGSMVSFPNDDIILHNAFSVSPDNRFDANLYGQGETFIHRFDRPGLVKVYCNVHHSMVGNVLVLDTPFFARPDATGQFRLDALPAGAGELLLWHERARLTRRPMVLPLADDASAMAITIDLTVRRLPPHQNKFGQSYRRTRDQRY